MTAKKQDIKKQKKKQIKVCLARIRTENNAIAKRLASIIVIVGSTRASQLGIDAMITELEAKLKKI
ncbi:hypothetical protein ES703_16288 [subsurface metagenome]